MTFHKDFVKIRFSFLPEMALFALLGVLRGFSGCCVQAYAFLSRFAGTANPCAAFNSTKIAYL
jgi:hypothetical protein